MKTWTLAVAAAIALSLAACKAPAPKAAAAAATAPRLKVALVVRTLQNDYFREMAETARRRQQVRADYDLEIRGAFSMDDVAGQIDIVEELTRKKPDVLIVAPSDSKALIPALKNAKDLGVAVVVIDSPLDPEAADAADLAAPFVGPDGQRGAKKAAAFLADAIRPGDRVAIIAGQKDSIVNKQRPQGATTPLRQVAIRIVTVEHANWERGQAKEAAKRILAQHPDIKGIVALNDPMALGALDAAREMRRKVFITGFDGVREAKEQVRKGGLLATVDQHGLEQASYAIDYVLTTGVRRIFDHETPTDLVTR